MENQTRFDLNAAIENWRNELASQTNLASDDRRELEAHLRDAIAGFQQRGLDDEESFRLASKRFGQPKQLAREFKKIMKESNWNRPLAFAAWVIFIVSFFLPSYYIWSGWQCAWMHHLFWHQALHGPSQWLSAHYEFLTFANLLMLASPLLLPRVPRKWLRNLTLAAMILVWSFGLVLLLRRNITDVKIGYYVWATSFAILWLSVILQPRRAMKKQTA